ncbi:MAG: 30S ribosomal protein S11 [Candidatus Woykebacteria bacterium RIFCSPHIGHO2_01_FULL_39_12]|uniref:Small ribosomal subunit protein uS11 n=2 Tax=Candidatus Woykeibacteriota TaxID=1817899 RepID=A0A1G1WDG5_9BACT|nr:MAG: 30S ribosomal protein S11 [Candidatus Woykebacteria bacterium RBG_16_39_9b]OGY27907.1 MAG: 30S ribosomal protein S11 [Candidatus Woykebacteria bacterium RIFCSPHIGHO2_01_FULL_39_12]
MAVAKKKQLKKEITRGRVYINASFNNTIVSITDSLGDSIVWGSSGAAGFKGARKSTPFAATTAAETAAKKALEKGVKEVEVFVRGPGSGRDAAIRAIKNSGIQIVAIADITPMPHNGPRPRKRRRV